jgi:hypothetical protein
MTRLLYWSSVLVFCSATAVSLYAHAGTVVVRSASSSVVNDIYMIDADMAFEFSDDALGALASGIPLIIEIDIKVNRRRRYLWDPNVLEVKRKYRIEKHALSERYVVTDLVTEDRSVYRSADEAVYALGRIRRLPLAERDRFAAGYEYRASIRGRLDIEALPAPLRPIAWISPSWRMSSQWFRWQLNP